MGLSKTHSVERGIGDLSCSSYEMGDHIGMESCVDLNHQEDLIMNQTTMDDRRGSSVERRDRRCEMMIKKREIKKDYPPPIPWLARTENLPSHMPWVMKRYHTSDGRLIIKEEKVKHHEYFRAHRSNGRLTLHLVPLDDDVDVVLGRPGLVGHGQSQDDDDNNDDEDDDGGFGLDGDDGIGKEDRTVKDSMESGGTVMMGYNSCNSERRNSCIFGMIVPAIRPVHI